MIAFQRSFMSVFFFPLLHILYFSGMPKRRRTRESRRWRRDRNCFKTFGMQQMPLTLGRSLQRCFPAPLSRQYCRGALLSMCGVCVFRILNSKGWGLIMEPDSSSPASICLTVPPIFLSIPSLPLFSCLSVSNPLCFSLAVTLLRAPLLHLFCLPLSLPLLFLLLSLRALGLSGSCRGSRRARWCRRRRHR